MGLASFFRKKPQPDIAPVQSIDPDILRYLSDISGRVAEVSWRLSVIDERLRKVESEEKEISLQLEAIDGSLHNDNADEYALVGGLIALADTVEDFYRFAAVSEDTAFFEQARMMWNAVKNAAENAGLEMIESSGEPFDFERCSVEDTRYDENLPVGYSIETLKCGYVYKDHMMRRAAVVVNRAKEAKEEVAVDEPSGEEGAKDEFEYFLDEETLDEVFNVFTDIEEETTDESLPEADQEATDGLLPEADEETSTGPADDIIYLGDGTSAELLPKADEEATDETLLETDEKTSPGPADDIIYLGDGTSAEFLQKADEEATDELLPEADEESPVKFLFEPEEETLVKHLSEASEVIPVERLSEPNEENLTEPADDIIYLGDGTSAEHLPKAGGESSEELLSVPDAESPDELLSASDAESPEVLLSAPDEESPDEPLPEPDEEPPVEPLSESDEASPTVLSNVDLSGMDQSDNAPPYEP